MPRSWRTSRGSDGRASVHGRTGPASVPTLTLTGLRRSELVALRWRHVDLLDGTLRVEESKSEEGERLIALPASLVEELAAHYAGSAYRSDDDFVLAHPERGSKLDHDWYRDRFLAALERRLLGVPEPGTKSPEPAPLSGNA